MSEKDKDKTGQTSTEGEGEGSESTETSTEAKKIIVEHIFKDERGQGASTEGDEEGEETEGEGEGNAGGEGGEKTKQPPAKSTPPAATTEGGETTTEGGEGTEKKTAKEQELEKKLKEREGQLAALALKEFEGEKKKLLDVVKDEKKREYVDNFIGTDPEKLEQVKLMTGLLGQAMGEGGVTVTGEGEGNDGEGDDNEGEGEGDDDTETPPPKGKVKAPPAKTGGYVDGKQIIDDLYNILSDPTKTKAEKDIANKKINELVGQFVKGSKDSGQIIRLKVMNCPACGATMEGNTCKNCGYVIPSWESKPPRGTL